MLRSETERFPPPCREAPYRETTMGWITVQGVDGKPIYLRQRKPLSASELKRRESALSDRRRFGETRRASDEWTGDSRLRAARGAYQRKSSGSHSSGRHK